MPALSLLKMPEGLHLRPSGGGDDEHPALKRKIPRARMPVKRSINFATVGEKPIDWRIAIPSIVLIVLIAGIISKVAVIDRFAALDAARAEVYQLQSKIREQQDIYDNLPDISSDYAHYTISDMSEEERNRISRVTVMEVVKNLILPVAPLDAWSLNENVLSIHVSSNTLTEITDMVERLKADPSVADCAVHTESTTVSSNDSISNEETITAEVEIIFKSLTQIQEERKAAEEAKQKAEEEEQQKAEQAAGKAQGGSEP